MLRDGTLGASMLKEEWKKAKEEYQKAGWISFILS